MKLLNGNKRIEEFLAKKFAEYKCAGSLHLEATERRNSVRHKASLRYFQEHWPNSNYKLVQNKSAQKKA